MSCAEVCIDMGCSDDPNDFETRAFRKARKPHECVECALTIAPGERYERFTAKRDDTIWSQTTCAVCCEIRQAFVCGSFLFGELWESIRESIFPRWAEEGPWDCLAKLTTQEARDRVNDEYETWRDGS